MTTTKAKTTTTIAATGIEAGAKDIPRARGRATTRARAAVTAVTATTTIR
jgi:hypothetical protein